MKTAVICIWVAVAAVLIQQSLKTWSQFSLVVNAHAARVAQ